MTSECKYYSLQVQFCQQRLMPGLVQEDLGEDVPTQTAERVLCLPILRLERRQGGMSTRTGSLHSVMQERYGFSGYYTTSCK